MNYIKEKKELLIDNAFILIGCFIASLGVNLFLSNAKLLSGGAMAIEPKELDRHKRNEK